MNTHIGRYILLLQDSARLIRAVALFFLLALLQLVAASPAAAVTIEPSTWNIIGLDSNTPASGPNLFPVGAKICGGTPGATGTAQFHWDVGGTDSGTYINLRPGSIVEGADLTFVYDAIGCGYAFFEVEVTKSPLAYNQTRRYHITSGGVSTPTPRELFVEHLVSQARNGVTDMILDGVSVAAGGTMYLAVGGTYDIELVGFTATNGYNQLESFINIPNTIFQVLGVTSSFNVVDAGSYNVVTDKVYANACEWVSDPNSPNYLSCIGDQKAGGDPTRAKYRVKVLGGAGTRKTVNTLIYDFSGSSFHYNADYSASARIIVIVNPDANIAKAFSPTNINPGGVSKLTITLTNPNVEAPVSGVNFIDVFPTLAGGAPADMVVATPLAATTTCVGGVLQNNLGGALAAGNAGIKLTGATIPANGSCTVTVDVTAPTLGTYNNTTQNLFVGAVDTTKTATASLTVDTTPPSPAPVCGFVMANWTFTGTTVPNPAYATKATDVATAIASSSGGTFIIDTTAGAGNPQPSWAGKGFQNTVIPLFNSLPYFQLQVDSSKYSNVTLTIGSTYADASWGGANNIYVWSSTDGSAYSATTPATGSLLKTTLSLNQSFPAAVSGVANTYFRIGAFGAQNANAYANLDNITVYGCKIPTPPTMTKSFSANPVAVGKTSVLTFNVVNPNATGLTGIAFTDTLPAGLTVATGSSTQCGGTLTTTNPSTLSFSGGTLGASLNCNITATITATTAGPHANVSGYVTATETGTNNAGAAGIASANLVAISPPSISKQFAGNPILTGGASALTFLITNPNPSNSLAGVAFSDTFPGTMVVVPAPLSIAPTLTFTAASKSITRSAGSFITDGFVVGQKISTTSGTNPGPFTIANVTALTLTVSETVTTQGATALTVYKYAATGCGAPTFTPVAGAGSISFSAGTIAAGATCQVMVNVTVPGAGSYSNTSGNVSHIINAVTENGNTATDTLTVTAPHPGITLLKQVSSTGAAGSWVSYLTTSVGGNVYYKFTIENTGDVPLNPVSVSDPTLATTGVDPATCVWVNPLPVASPTQDPVQTCVKGPVVAVAGLHPNTATATGTYAATAYTDTSTANYATTGLTLTKSATEGSFSAAGQVLHYSYLVNNSGAAVLTGPITVADDKSTNESCPAISTVGDLDNYLDPGESITCTSTYTVLAADVTAGSVTNIATATAVGSSVTSNTSSKTINYGTGVNVTGKVYSDANHNGILDNNEDWTGGTTVYAKLFAGACPASGTASSVQTLTVPTGSYAFGAVAAGNYCIVLSNNATTTETAASVPAGWVNGLPSSGILSVTVASVNLADQNFGLYSGSKLTGRVCKDDGIGGGTANDGICNAAEAGISGVTVTAHQAGCTSTVCATAITDGGGNYEMWLSVTGAITLIESNLSGYLSTGGEVGNTGGTHTRSTDTTAFTVVAGTNYTGLNFGDVPENQFLTDGAQAAMPGSVVFYPHTFIAGTTGTVSFATSRTSSPAVSGWSEVIYVDANCNAMIDSAEAIVPASTAVTAGQTVCLLLKEFVPAGAPINAQNAVTVTATFASTFSGSAVSFDYVRHDTTTVGQPSGSGLTLVKSVSAATALPGANLTYTVVYTNRSSEILSNVVIYDSTPYYTTFVSAGCGALPLNLTLCSITNPGVGATGSITYTMTGTLAAGGSGSVWFTVQVQP